MKPDEAVVAMSQAHESGDVATARDLLATRPDLERLAPDSTWLHRAAEAGQVALIDFWLGRGWDVNHNLYDSKSDGEATPLHDAKDAATTRHLLSRGARVNAWSRYAGTPLHCAVVGAVEVSQRGRRRESPDSLADQIRVLLEAGADPALADFDGLTPLALAVQLRRKTAEKALRAAGAPEKGRRPPKQPSKAPAIDLRRDSRRIASTLTKAIKQFARESADRPLTGLYLAVSGIEGYAMVAFDVSGESNPWDASHSEYARVEFPKWRDAYGLSATGVRITEIDGTALNWPKPVGDAEFEKPFFRACVAVLEQAQASKAFEPLARASSFAVGVEATLGEDGRVWQPGTPRNRR
jgi:ankyrin repeat protein